MKFTILLKNEDDSTEPLTVSQIERKDPLNAATLGLTLAESKQVLAKVFDQGHLFHHLLDRGYIFFDSPKVILGKQFKQEENKDLYLKASPPNALKPTLL